MGRSLRSPVVKLWIALKRHSHRAEISNVTFAFPWAFLGLLALPALAAIYWLRQRARRRPVSSLLLWRDAHESRASGRHVERFEASRLFLLELLILALLVTAAAGPRLPTRDARRPLVVVLDDSFSMLAGGDVSPKQAATAALLRELDSGRHGAVTLVAAGERPQVLGDGSSSAEAAAERLGLWQAMSHTSRLELAIALAADLGDDAGDRARLLVLSDHPPPEPLEAGSLAWWAFGRGVSNLALVAAMRSPEGRGDTSDSCLVEVANYAPRPAAVRLSAAEGESAATEVSRLELAAGEISRVRFSVPRGQEVRLRWVGEPPAADSGDALALDDQAILLPERNRGVRVALEVGDVELRQLIRDTLAASERAIFTQDRAELVITDGAIAEMTPAGWQLRLVTGGPTKPYFGPFVLDRGHAMTDGLDLDGVIWGAGDDSTGSLGEPVITAGDVVLFADREVAGGGHALTMFWRPDQSTVQRTPNWPILWWNLLEWRGHSIPGVRAANLRLGGEAKVGLAAADGSAELELPDGSRRRLTAQGGRLAIQAEQLGIHRLQHGSRSDRWAVNALAAGESDLRNAESGRWGSWDDGGAARWQARSVAWILLLMTAAGLVLHLFWTRTQR